MPLEQRVIKPILISRSTLPLDSQGNPISIPNELECVTNGTLANIIRQLSSLSRYAEDLFAGILHEATLLIARSTSLQGRIDRLAVKVTQLDSSVEEVSLKDIQLRKPFKSCASYDQQVVARTTMPESIKEIYMSCDRPPPLEKLNAYRDDGKDGLKFYTDPNYFFELWAKEMLEVTEKEKSGKKNAHRGPNKGQGDLGPNERRRGKPRQPQNTAREIMAKIPATEFIDQSRLQQQQQTLHHQQLYQHPNGPLQGVVHYGQPQHYSQTLERPRSLGINQYQGDGYHHMDPMAVPQTIPNHPPPAYYPPGSIMTQNPYHTGNMGNQGTISQISSPGRGSHTPPPSYFATPSGTGDSMISINQMPGSQQQNQGTPTRRINAQGSASSITARPSQPPPAPPSNPPSSNSSSGGTPTVGTPSRSRGPSLTRESLPPPPPPPPPPPNSGMNGGVRDSIDSELPLPPPSGAHMSPPQAYIPSENSISNQTTSVPPPPPPPPPEGLLSNSRIKKDGPSVDSNMKNGVMPGSNLAQEILQKQSQVMQSKTSTMNKVLPQHIQQNNGRSDLLAAIREGIILRKVDENKQKQIEKSTPLLDVASILARRKAMEYSDSESEAGNSDESGSDNWNDDESEC
ncbi:wiskott-Aldrich syndrome protein family member 3 isoform X1 [Tetranychus urticae]|uniref:Wiskott-Aldrich syndrome protein family member n=1 Tax=Tetranychus urticae TaxID=32264 RepID=T1KTG8_TETUR|nr:wiskott-Aldrich syndrome protein family member 3 isoform X1 [Tetranychus urticae]